EVHPSSVTKMIQKLDKDEYVHYEKYRGFVLTDKGNKVGKRLVFRHDLLEDFLEIIGVDEEKIYNDVEGIEHHLSWKDRKSTRLNSSHVSISYAVFCLKKKNQLYNTTTLCRWSRTCCI